MIQIVLATHCIVKIIRYLCQIRCGMVWNYINNNLDSILISLGTHRLKIISCAQLIVTNLPVSRLILPPPAAVCTIYLITSHKLHIWISVLALIRRRGLDSCKACRCYVLHILLDCVEAPTPGVQNSTILNVIGQSILRSL